MSSKSTELRELLHRCVTDHIHRARQAYSLCQVIGDHAWVINREGFGDLFEALQVSLADEMVLSLTKVLEPADPRRPRRTIPAVLDFLEANAVYLEVRDRGRLEAAIAADPGFDPDGGMPENDQALTLRAVTAMRRSLPKPKPLWIRRDKRIAHSVDVKVPEELRARWNEAQELLAFAQSFAATVGEGYGVFVFEANDGSYMLTESSQEASRSLQELLERADLVDLHRGRRPRIEHRGLTAEAEDAGGFWFARVIDVNEPIVATAPTLEGVDEAIRLEIDDHLGIS